MSEPFHTSKIVQSIVHIMFHSISNTFNTLSNYWKAQFCKFHFLFNQFHSWF